MSEICIEEATLEELLDYLSQQEESAVEEVRERLEDLHKRIALLEAVAEVSAAFSWMGEADERYWKLSDKLDAALRAAGYLND
jgi:chaperonin cofactor prefoldin